MKNNSHLIFPLFFILIILFFASYAQISGGNEKISASNNGKPGNLHSISAKPFDVVDFSGEGGYEIVPNPNVWTFFGPVRRITVNGQQTIIGSGSAVFGMTAGTSRIAVSLCYQKMGQSVVSSMVGDNHLVADVDSLQRTFAVTGTITLPAGTYSVGYCVVNRSNQIIGNNNYVNGWAMVIN